jgi:hypothetical protein
MDELLKKLLNSEVLTEETKNEIKTAFEKIISEVTEKAKKEAEEKIRVELTEQFIADREKLIEALDTKAEEFFTKEIDELKEDINNFRDLEVEFAEKEVKLKKELQETVKADMQALVRDIDEYLDMTLASEFQELRESIEEARKNDFGMKIFEAFQQTFRSRYVDENKIQSALSEATKELNIKNKELKKLKEEFASLTHAKKLAEVLEPLTGRSREVMEAILKTQPTEKLEETYSKYIGRVLTETAVNNTTHTAEKDKKVLAESDKSEKPVIKTVIKTGDKPAIVNENGASQTKVLDEHSRNSLRKLAGIE